VASDLQAAVREELAAGPGPVMVAAPCREAGDSLLLGLLADLETTLAAEVSWAELPRFTLLTGRNLASFSWMVAKMIVAARDTSPLGAPLRLAHFRAGEPTSQVVELRLGEPNRPRSAPRQDLLAPELIASLMAPADVVALQTHGTDSCAKGGGGVVLCGLGSEAMKIHPEATGVLACGQGYACPRGPYPLRLSLLTAQVLMLASCNSLRLGDSALAPNFNLGLAFLDGEGLAYVGSLFGALGNDLASIAFLAALASNRSLAEATTLVNGFLSCAGIERAVYVAVGMPDHRLAGRPRERDSETRWGAQGLEPFEIDCSSENLLELRADDPLLVDLAEKRCLAMSLVSSLPGPGISWFHRLERSASECVILRIFVFRFPEALGTLRLSPCDCSDLKRRSLAAFDSLARWLELGRISGLARREPEDYLHLAVAEVEAREAIVHTFLRMTFDGSASEQAQERLVLIHSLAAAARALVLEEFLSLLTGPFWLPNVFGREYGYGGSTETACPNCGRSAVRKTLRHPLHGAERKVDVCPHCGIVRDDREGSAFEIASVEAPVLARLGGPLKARVTLRSKAPEKLVVEICPRLSTYGLREVIPTPERAEATLEIGAGAVLEFSFQIPVDLPPHQYFFKILAASEEDLAFASRMIFFRWEKSLV
jgi:hypothetical protein